MINQAGQGPDQSKDYMLGVRMTTRDRRRFADEANRNLCPVGPTILRLASERLDQLDIERALNENPEQSS